MLICRYKKHNFPKSELIFLVKYRSTVDFYISAQRLIYRWILYCKKYTENFEASNYKLFH